MDSSSTLDSQWRDKLVSLSVSLAISDLKNLKENVKKKKKKSFKKRTPKQYEKYLKYGTLCLVSTDPPGLGGATVGEV